MVIESFSDNFGVATLFYQISITFSISLVSHLL